MLTTQQTAAKNNAAGVPRPPTPVTDAILELQRLFDTDIGPKLTKGMPGYLDIKGTLNSLQMRNVNR
jgi:hypothetical protein